MAGLLDLFSGRSSDIYGNGLLTPEQRGGLGNIGLLALAGKLGQLAGPSFSPVPDFGAALGQAAGAYGASQEGAGTAALNAILTGQKGRKLEQELDYYKQLGPILQRAAQGWPGADGGAGGGEGSGSTGGGAAAQPGAGGGGGPGSDPRGMIPHITAEATRLGIDPAVALQVARSEGLGSFYGDGGKSGGSFQLYTGGGMGNDFQRDTGLNPLDPKNEKATITYALEQAAQKGWGAWNGAKKLGITGFTGIGKPGAAPTAAAPAGDGWLPNFTTGRAGLLGGTADAGDTTAPAGGSLATRKPSEYLATLPPGINDQTPQQQHLANLAAGGRGLFPPGTKFNRNGSPISGDLTATLPGQQSGANIPPAVARSLGASRLYGGSGSSAAASEDIYAGDSEPRGPAGDPGPAGPTAMVSGLLTPGGPLSRGGVPGMPAMPPAAAPSADPSLQLGPLAPAPAAAAPAAPGPGLLAAPGALPAVPALPRVNPAFDAYARQLAVAQGLATGAGLPNALGPLLEAFKSSPGYRAQQIIAEKGAAQPFEQAQTLFNKQIEIAGVGPIEAAKLPYALAQAYFKAEQDIRTAGPIAAAQNFERIRADNALKGIITTRDADGNIKIAVDPDVVKAVTGATVTAPEQAKAEIARETTRIQQAQQAALDLAKQREQVGSIDPIKARNEVLAGEYKETVSAADAASKAQVPLTQIENAMPDFRTGQTAQTRLTLAKTWQDFASNIGLPPNSDFARMIASGEIINKSGTTLGFELARTLGSHEAQNIVQQAVAANPGLAVSPGGNKELIGLIKQGLQRDIDKREYFDNHFRQYGSYDRAATEFNRTNPVEKYVSQILPYTVSTPADAAKLPPGTRFKSPNDPSGLVRTVPER